MKKRVNKNLPLLGFRENIERDDATQNVTFETDGSVETRPGLKEVILPEDPRYKLAKLADDWSTFAGGADLNGGPFIFIPLIPEGEKEDWKEWNWRFIPDGGTSGTGSGTIEGYNPGGTKVVSEPTVVNNPESGMALSFTAVLPAAVRGSPYSVSLAGAASGGVGPYKIYVPANRHFSAGTTKDPWSTPTFFGVVIGGDRQGPNNIELLSELPSGLLAANSFQSTVTPFLLPIYVYDSSSPQLWTFFGGEIVVDVGKPEIAGKDTYGEIDLGTLTVGVPYTHTFTITGGKGTVRWEQLFPPPNGLTFNVVTGTLAGTPTGNSTSHSARIVVNDLVLTTDATTSAAVTFDGAWLSDYAEIRWTENVGPNPPILTLDPGTNNLLIPIKTLVEAWDTRLTAYVSSVIGNAREWITAVAAAELVEFALTLAYHRHLLDGVVWIHKYRSLEEVTNPGLPRGFSYRIGLFYPNIYVKNGTGTAPFTYELISDSPPSDILSDPTKKRFVVTDALGLTGSYDLVFVPGASAAGTNATDGTGGNFGVQGGTQGPSVNVGKVPNGGGMTNPAQAPRFTSSPATAATVGVAYSYTPTADGNSSISLVSGPAWLTFAAGILSGTPAVGNIGYSAVILAAAGSSGTTSQSFSIKVSSASAGNPAFTSTPVTVATVGIPYTYSITTSGTQPPFVITAPVKPAVLTLIDNGNGTATLNGTFGITGVNAVQLLVTDNIGGTDYQNFNITVS